MAQARKKRRRQAVRDEPKPIPPWIWLGLGVLMGLGLAVYLAIVGLIPTQGGSSESVGVPAIQTPKQTGSEDLSIEAEVKADPGPREYDFYKILPEMEVVIPEAELQHRANASNGTVEAPAYIIQAGSFENRSDADSMKARLALLGLSAREGLRL